MEIFRINLNFMFSWKKKKTWKYLHFLKMKTWLWKFPIPSTGVLHLTKINSQNISCHGGLKIQISIRQELPLHNPPKQTNTKNNLWRDLCHTFVAIPQMAFCRQQERMSKQKQDLKKIFEKNIFSCVQKFPKYFSGQEFVAFLFVFI